MAWVYQQSTGKLSRNGKLVSIGYAGADKGKNNPELQNVTNVGPLPRGKYIITGRPFHHPTTGKYSIRLQPCPSNEMFGRAGFLIHGDSIARPGTASTGCIIMPLRTRQEIWASNDRYLEVIL
ncbi:DUF2778 domain-containing protein [Serratia sp. JUb9]|uniref:tlde1 domain-containing protein n=1 Tax=unclassified Serratia (in: enterobacteria) TaxID=2647522 RepID=UPI000CF5F5D2|nr:MULTISPECIES: tlde1 domain-containing protein [unclassified Serratia (in: enterobacteria)]AVJ16440.1 DUF2778 domain-containing protein [Serratia sp. MYb239]QNK31619.1 DUF2778 domain-containing protein [Serratia sp. JUb9]